jgi:hypothetical protein
MGVTSPERKNGALICPKLTTPRHENLKIRHKNELFKANESTPSVYTCQIYRMIPKNIP